jgi:Zn ribbon nucleic-acid-binding protein
MYVILPSPKQKCSACGSIDQVEVVTRHTPVGSVTHQRCIICGHTKEISKTTIFSDADSKEWTNYTIKEQPRIEEY